MATGQADSEAEGEEAPSVHGTGDASRVWLPELVQRVAAFLPANVVACTLRLVDKATAALFKGPEHTVVLLSQPVPEAAFAQRWGRPEKLRALTLSQRQKLLRLTARSGSLHNLQTLVAMPDYFPPLCKDVFSAAASAGHLHACEWLLERSCPWGGEVLSAAARAGHQHVCSWLLAKGCPWSDTAPAQAAHGGHLALAEWLAQQRPGEVDAHALLVGAAEGCELPTLQRLHSQWLEARGQRLHSWHEGPVLDAAAGSPTADWRAKVEWLQGRGYDWEAYSLRCLLPRADWRERAAWLLERGFPLGGLQGLARIAAGAGDTDALGYLFSLGVQLSEEHAQEALCAAVRHGHLPAARAVCPPAHRVNGQLLAAVAARNGQLRVLEWLLELLGPVLVLTRDTFRWAAGSGSVDLLAWLRDRDCPWSARAFEQAVQAGSEDQMQWLLERGCPTGADGEPYLAASSNDDVAALCCLQRLGCACPRDTFMRAVRRMAASSGPPPSRRALRWLLQQGCDAEWPQAEVAAQLSVSQRELHGIIKELRDWHVGGADPPVG
ncbi:hypothetical protein GPECTOR_19g315 [Gonium pectorale]|uniref:Ankyrin repeat domain-containing protein n=1 Tax=Gonium pectorale TaxID=33097 RepID=A0A150GJC5_GONPE|nr:hypothetical protein GPECTOR_19g315 [Gonium pectorale]|eukprot:KXZ49864.1 hypothetical protein GPECTOR_19g315 [Gonium pectorale]